MNKDAITFTTLAQRLEKRIHADVGMEGLNILIYGWIHHTKIPYEKNPTIHSLYMREERFGEKFLTKNEAKWFSIYAGYDLTKD